MKKQNKNKDLGCKGENAARKFLNNKGYEIIETNWNCCFGEADIIALYEDTIVFVEVKTRSNLSKGLPEDAIDSAKRRKYEQIAASYLKDNQYIDMSVRFDVIAILVINEQKALIRHHVNAFGVS